MRARIQGRRAGQQTPPFQVTLELLVTAAGTLFLAFGLRQWAALAWANDTAGARTPVAYGSRVALPAEANALPPAARWIIALSDAPTTSVCARTLGASAPESQRASVGVVAANGPVVTVATCSAGLPGRSGAVQTAVVHRPLGWVPQSGFIVTDRTGRVVYGSFDLGYLAHALPSLALLD